jgi:hypothetical protein
MIQAIESPVLPTVVALRLLFQIRRQQVNDPELYPDANRLYPVDNFSLERDSKSVCIPADNRIGELPPSVSVYDSAD